MLQRPLNANRDRRGAVAVECAVIAPVLVSIVLGMIEVNRVFDAQTMLETAAREGARFASIDREGMLEDGQSTSEKIASDVANILASNGIDQDDITVAIKHADNPDLDFDADDPANDLALFEVQVGVNYSAISFMPVPQGQDFALTASVVFRNGRATLSQ